MCAVQITTFKNAYCVLKVLEPFSASINPIFIDTGYKNGDNTATTYKVSDKGGNIFWDRGILTKKCITTMSTEETFL